MPFHASNIYAPVIRILVDGSQQLVNTSVSSGIYSNLDNTVKRIRPTDLFANGTPRSGIEEKWWYGNATVKDGSGNPVIGPVSYWAGHTFATIPADSSDLSSKLRAKIKNQNVSLGQMFAEGRQSVNLLCELATDAIRFYRYLRKEGFKPLYSYVASVSGSKRRKFPPGGLNPFQRKQKDLARRWLQYNWGMKPLIDDLYGCVNLYMAKVKLGQYRYASARVKSDGDWQVSTPKVGDLKVDKGGRWQQSSVAKGRYFISEPALKTLSETGMINLPSVLWEVTPYSFVIDSLINIGEVLNSMDALAGVSSIQYQVTIRSYQSVWVTANGGTGLAERKYYSRGNVMGSLPMPKLQFKQSGGMQKALNLLALLRQLQLR